MEKLKNLTNIILYDIIKILLFVLSIPFIIVIFPVKYFWRKKFEKKYSKFLNENQGKNFFCYNNRKSSKDYIEENIIPRLTSTIEIVYLNGKKIESNYNIEFISESLHKLKNYKKFPHLMKIRNGKLIDKSVNNLFYGVLNLNKSKTELLNEIHFFYKY